ncbi:fimbrial protein [Serratia fonticola]|uniref:fimbrial protein n=1 Tax=Serratia fonticola TaxID=47917 RepID=UPI003986F6DF
MADTEQKVAKNSSQDSIRRAVGSCLARMLVGSLLLNASLTRAATGEVSNVKVNITGTIVANARCDFGQNSPITMEYGDVYISDIAGDAYKKRMHYSVFCSGDASGKTIQLQFSGSGAGFDGTLLRTDAQGLGIKILRNNSQMILGQWYDLNPSSPPTLEGVLVKQNGASFTNGQEFNASATLKVAYN